MKYISLLLFLFVLSCNNERILELPEIDHSEIREVLDVSPAYIFYDETEQDSVLFNRKNLIGTTNWLVNVDKRLTLKQVLPHLQYLQEKRHKKGMHTNENAKNYFTCNDTSINNLGFIDFTEVNYRDASFNLPEDKGYCLMTIDSLQNMSFSNTSDLTKKFSAENLMTASETYLKEEFGEVLTIVLKLDHHLSFQDYIRIKSNLQKIKSSSITLDSNELIY